MLIFIYYATRFSPFCLCYAHCINWVHVMQLYYTILFVCVLLLPFTQITHVQFVYLFVITYFHILSHVCVLCCVNFVYTLFDANGISWLVSACMSSICVFGLRYAMVLHMFRHYVMVPTHYIIHVRIVFYLPSLPNSSLLRQRSFVNASINAIYQCICDI